MSGLDTSAALRMTLTLLSLCLVTGDSAASPTRVTDTPEKTAPQGQDPPGAAEADQASPPIVERNGVIPPPATGDEEIYTQAPNPDAGHEEEVIPPPGTPGGDPTIEPR
jgi:hypothetical protein